MLSLDPHSVGADGYTIRSLYFDGVYDQALDDKASGIFSREKYRIRCYNGNDRTIKLERKSKYGEYVSKESASMTRAEYERILMGDAAFLEDSDDPLLKDFYTAIVHRGFRPAVIVEYVREAYLYGGDIRITFDKKLAAGVNTYDLFDPALVTLDVLGDARTIMEIKYDGFFPEAVRALVQPESFQRSAISKYLLCREVALRHFKP
jgi:hypothetical protein